jgi:HrpA-like RNA helicase
MAEDSEILLVENEEVKTFSLEATYVHSKRIFGAVNRYNKSIKDAYLKNLEIMKKFYREHKHDIDLLVQHSENVRVSGYEDLQELVSKIRIEWSNIEREVHGPVVIITADMKWDTIRRILAAEDIREAMIIEQQERARTNGAVIGNPVFAFIIDKALVSDPAELEEFTRFLEHVRGYQKSEGSEYIYTT